jgi:hypothetical protein
MGKVIMLCPNRSLRLLGVILILAGSVLGQAQARAGLKDDWSAFFPEFKNCERTVNPIAINGDVIEQTADYEFPGRRDRTDPNYFPCGSISLRMAPRSLKPMLAQDDIPFLPTSQKGIVRGYTAIHHSPLCGNDPWLGSLEVYFDDDKVLTVSASVGAAEILELAETAGYRAMKVSMDRLRRSHRTRKS